MTSEPADIFMLSVDLPGALSILRNSCENHSAYCRNRMVEETTNMALEEGTTRVQDCGELAAEKEREHVF